MLITVLDANFPLLNSSNSNRIDAKETAVVVAETEKEETVGGTSLRFSTDVVGSSSSTQQQQQHLDQKIKMNTYEVIHSTTMTSWPHYKHTLPRLARSTLNELAKPAREGFVSMCACTEPVRTRIGAVCVEYGRPKWPITMLNHTCTEKCLVFYLWHPMLV